ncbi:MAG: DUF1207 domain-containing protein [Bacteroidetes bacterium]|nr:DUF1207 domain-containing protein [Bacteroidota bacterium]MBU1679933.1 DUF1207 domain-containing protein [Bacteroidota bacterium]MBU2508058.1 DUF1207 domain-containing protein [Bacteroidota bacterium]
MADLFKKTSILFIWLTGLIFSQNISFKYLPNDLNFQPLRANHQEARLGVLYFPNNGHLKVDIGNTVDLLQFTFDSEIKLTCGIDFMAYALSTNYQGKRLQIDAIDGFFGGNFSLTIPQDDGRFISRFRIIHNSAHFVDGHWDEINDNWKDNLEPIPFTQDFGEITVGREKYFDQFGMKYYGAIAYATLVRPSVIKKYSFSSGLEINGSEIINPVFERKVNLFYAVHARLFGSPDYQLSVNNMLGIKFGNWREEGIVFYLSYYKGNSWYSEYYYNRVSKFGIGFFVEFI